jgi:hypothetical protein
VRLCGWWSNSVGKARTCKRNHLRWWWQRCEYLVTSHLCVFTQCTAASSLMKPASTCVAATVSSNLGSFTSAVQRGSNLKSRIERLHLDTLRVAEVVFHPGLWVWKQIRREALRKIHDFTWPGRPDPGPPGNDVGGLRAQPGEEGATSRI